MRYLFEDYALDTDRRELRRGGTPVAIEPQVFDLLAYLVQHGDRVVTKDNLFTAVWNGRFVSESALTTRINAARTALGDDGKAQRLLRTLRGRGVRFVGDVRVARDATSSRSIGTVHEKPSGSGEIIAGRRLNGTRVLSDLPMPSAVSSLPSIAVLPFRVVPDGVTAYFGDGIVEDIVLSLASLHELFVISRGTTLAYRESDMTPAEIAEELGVRYVVNGSVRRAGDSLRVWVELSDTSSSELIWTDKIECKSTELFQVQDQIVEDMVVQIAPNVRHAELKRALRKPSESLSAYDYLLRALDLIYKLERTSFDTASELLRKSRELDPTFALPYAWGAWSHMYRVALDWSQDDKSDIEEATRLAEAALRLDSRNARALATFGHLKAYLHHDYNTALHYLSNAIKSCPNDPFCWALSSASSSYVSAGSDAITKAERALRLSPLDKYRFYYVAVLALAHYTCGQYEEAVKWGHVGMSENAGFTPNLRYLTAALAASGKIAEARQLARLFLERQQKFTLKKYESSGMPFRDLDLRRIHLEHLRRAELPQD